MPHLATLAAAKRVVFDGFLQQNPCLGQPHLRVFFGSLTHQLALPSPGRVLPGGLELAPRLNPRIVVVVVGGGGGGGGGSREAYTSNKKNVDKGLKIYYPLAY